MKVIVVIFLLFIGCKKNNSKQTFDNVTIDEKIVQNDSIKILSKVPEIKNYKTEKIESQNRTSSVIQTLTFTQFSEDNISSKKEIYAQRFVHFDNYKAKANLENDTLNIFINNNNGEFGNGILIQVFENNYLIKNIDPNTIRNKLKFVEYKMSKEKLILDKSSYKSEDSIYGFVNYTCEVNGENLTKNMKGYFKTKIK